MKALFYRDFVANKNLPLILLLLIAVFVLASGGDSSNIPVVVWFGLANYLLLAIALTSSSNDKISHADRYYQAAPLTARRIVNQRFLFLYAGIFLLIIIEGALGTIFMDSARYWWLLAATMGLFMLLVSGISVAVGYFAESQGFTIVPLIVFIVGVIAFGFLAKTEPGTDAVSSLLTDHTNAVTATTLGLMVVLGAVLYELSVRIYRRKVN